MSPLVQLVYDSLSLSLSLSHTHTHTHTHTASIIFSKIFPCLFCNNGRRVSWCYTSSLNSLYNTITHHSDDKETSTYVYLCVNAQEVIVGIRQHKTKRLPQTVVGKSGFGMFLKQTAIKCCKQKIKQIQLIYFHLQYYWLKCAKLYLLFYFILLHTKRF